MEASYAFRKTPLLDECQIAPEIFEQVIPRVSTFMEPFVTIFHGQVDDQHATTYVCGLLSDVARKNIESIADRFGQSRLPLQGFIGSHAWDDEPWRQELPRQVKTPVGQGAGVLGCDPSGFPKSGRASVGVARQWCGRLGQVDHCQVALYVGSVARKGHTLVDARLYLPNEWTQDKARLDKAGVPKGSGRDRTRHQLALEMLAKNGAGLPHSWIAGDDEMGRPAGFRRPLAALGERYRWAVPSNTTMRALDVEPPASSGRRRRPKRPWQRVEAWSQSLADETWGTIAVRDGAKGPLGVEAVKRRVVSRNQRRQQGDEELLGVLRYRDRDDPQGVKVDDSLSNAVPETPLGEWARVAKVEHRIEECLQRSKSEAGLADYEVRHWTGWHPHQTLSFLATGFLVRETERGKKMDPCDDLAADASGYCHALARGVSGWDEVAYAVGVPEALATQ